MTQQKQYPTDRRAFTYFSKKAMFIVSLTDNNDFVMFEWRQATGDKQYNGEKIITKISKRELALLTHALYLYAIFGDQAFLGFVSRVPKDVQLIINNQPVGIKFFHNFNNTNTTISLSYYNGALFLGVNKNNVKLSIPIGIDNVYDIYATFHALHEYIVQNYIYGKKQLAQQNQQKQSGNYNKPPTQPQPQQTQPQQTQPQPQPITYDIPWEV